MESAPTKFNKKVGHIIFVFCTMMCPIFLFSWIAERNRAKKRSKFYLTNRSLIAPQIVKSSAKGKVAIPMTKIMRMIVGRT